MPDKISFVGVGNNAIDVTCNVSDTLLHDLKIIKSSCVFPDRAGVEALEAALKSHNIPLTLEPGGSAANTACTLGALGDTAAIIGKTALDDYGRLFAQSMEKWNVLQPIPPANDALASTTRIYTFITPDKDRSFSAYHGSSDFLEPADIDPALIAQSRCLYVDGYILASKNGAAVARTAMSYARASGCLAVFNPSSPSVIEGWPDVVRELMALADGIICNAMEASMLTGGHTLDGSLASLAQGRKFAALTMGADGAYAQSGTTIAHRPNPAFDFTIVNTNGAGDNFAGGFLYGVNRGWTLERSLDLGLACAVNVLAMNGPRPQASLANLVKAA